MERARRRRGGGEGEEGHREVSRRVLPLGLTSILITAVQWQS